VREPEAIEPGMVVVIGDDSMLQISTQSYDKRVAGVVTGAGSLRPGIILGRHASSQSRLPVALIGRVHCRVDATTSPLMIGDLLTTSAMPGHAMKAVDPARAHGAVIGKALQCQPEGRQRFRSWLRCNSGLRGAEIMAINVRTSVANRLGKSATLSLFEEGRLRGLQQRQPAVAFTAPPDGAHRDQAVGSSGISDGHRHGQQLRPELATATRLGQRQHHLQRECDGAWIYCQDTRTVDRPDLTFLAQNDCGGVVGGHVVSDDEDELFDLGRDLGANIVYYYIFSGLKRVGGCAAHPPGRRGFWVGSPPNNPPASPEVAFAHELTHVVGDNGHVSTPNNLMLRAKNKPVSSTLTNAQEARILADPDMEQP
jgi:hypothetical protein